MGEKIEKMCRWADILEAFEECSLAVLVIGAVATSFCMFLCSTGVFIAVMAATIAVGCVGSLAGLAGICIVTRVENIIAKTYGC